jgi:hypothetical protein
MRYARLTKRLILIAALLACTLVLRAGTARSAGNCTEAALDAVLASGGTLVLNCANGGAPVTITLANDLIAGNSRSATTIDGMSQPVTIKGNGSGSVLSVLNGVTLTLEGLTITGGAGTGGINNLGGTLTLVNSTLTGNTATNGGGIANSNGGTLTLTNSTLSGNAATNAGGGIFNDNMGTLMLSNSTLSGNSAARGGGIYNDSTGTLTLTNSTLSGNAATRGGGIANSNGWFTLASSILDGNRASTDPECDGGFYTYDYNLLGTINSTDCPISNILSHDVTSTTPV